MIHNLNAIVVKWWYWWQSLSKIQTYIIGQNVDSDHKYVHWWNPKFVNTIGITQKTKKGMKVSGHVTIWMANLLKVFEGGVTGM